MNLFSSHDGTYEESIIGQDESKQTSTCLIEGSMKISSDEPSSKVSLLYDYVKSPQKTEFSSVSATCTPKYHFTSEPLKISLESDDSCDESSWSENLSDEDIEMYEENDFSYFHKKNSKDISHKPHHNNIDSVHLDCSSPSPCSLHQALQCAYNLQDQSLATDIIEGHPTCTREEPVTPHLSSRASSYSPKKKAKINTKKRVSVNKVVTVVTIPSRDEYPFDLKHKLWSSSAELYANAARNTVEFASEGWNWKSVLEEEHMLVHQGNGEFIHPIHLQNVLACISQADNTDEQRQLIASLVPNSSLFHEKLAESTSDAPPTSKIIATSANTNSATSIVHRTNECPAA